MTVGQKRSLKFAVLGFSHETNTFVESTTSLADFDIRRGRELYEAYRDSHTVLAGYFDAAESLGFEAVPLMFASAVPWGIIERTAFESILDELLAALRSGSPWDGVLLALHGAAVAVGYPDADGEVVAQVRSLVGPDVPIGVTLDLHANISRRMVETSNVTVVYRTNPHLDTRDRGRECAELVYKAALGQVRPVQALETPPLLVNIVKQHTGSEPMASLLKDLDALRGQPGILSAGIAQGYPYADVPEMGVAVVVVHSGDVEEARAAARWLAQRIWTRRGELLMGELPSPEEALRGAMAVPRGPVVLMDVGDNIGGGGPGDSTVLLAAARRLGVRGYLQTIFDPEAVQACVAAGPGARLTVRVGGKTDRRHGEPVEIHGRVRLISDGRFEEPSPTHGGQRYFDAGLTAVLETDDDFTLVLTSRRVPNTSLQQMYSVGVDPRQKRVIVAKGVVAPRGAYEPIAAEVILVNTPGVTSADLSRFDYRHRRRPLFPFESQVEYP
jgi:microcystin degradation protein MlrC